MISPSMRYCVLIDFNAAHMTHENLFADEVRCEEEVALVVQSQAGESAADIVREHWRFKLLLMHLISLMHGVALARLRSDYKLSNLEV